MAREGFNANARAAERESGPIAIGEATYYPARLTNKRLRDVRVLARKAGLEAETKAKETDEYREAYEAAIENGKDEKAALELAKEAGSGAESVAEINLKSLQDQLPVLLKDETDKPPSSAQIRKHLEEDLDARDVEGLMNYLLGASDPTSETTAATTS